MDEISNDNLQDVETAKAVFLTGIVLCVCFVLPILVSSGKNISASIDSKLNPNAAAICELSELPNIGPARAKAITEYRQGQIKAFKSVKDLEKVKGIGEKTAGKLEQWLKFENDTD